MYFQNELSDSFQHQKIFFPQELNLTLINFYSGNVFKVTKCFPLETYLLPLILGVPLFSISVLAAGSLGTSVFDMNAVLVGASGGVYALLTAHVANILLVS